MKKGFTLIELIIVMVLISLIGTISIVLTKNNINDKTYTNSLKRALEAVNVYINTEKDSAGNTYFNGIYEGGEGVIVPIKDLYNKGYINETDYNVLIKKLSNDKEYFVAGFKNEDECTSGVSISIAGASNLNKTTYICGYGNTTPELSFINTKKMNVSLNKFAVSKEFYDSVEDANKANYLTPDENGLFLYYSESSKIRYLYFRGDVNNNYVKFGKSKDGNDLIWRILWFNDNNKMKLVLDDAVPLYYTNENGSKIKITDTNNKVYQFAYKRTKGTESDKSFILPTITSEPYSFGTNYIYTVPQENFIRDSFDFSNSSSDKYYLSGNFYFNQSVNWFNSTNLNDYSFITKNNNFCINTCMNDEDNPYNYYYYPSTNFECVTGKTETNNNNNCTNTVSNISSVVGYLSYGDLIRAGVVANKGIDLIDSGNYLINSTKSIIIPDKKELRYTSDNVSSAWFQTRNHYFTSKGINFNYDYEMFNEVYNQYFTLKNSTTNTTYYHGATNVKRWDFSVSRYETNLYATVLKPVIVIDTTDIELSGTGIKVEPYEIKVK